MAEYFTRKQGYPKPYDVYASISCTVSGVLYDVKENTTFFDHIVTGRELGVRAYTTPINIILNSSGNDAIGLAAGESVSIQNLNIQNIYLETTSSGNATVKLMMFGWN